ncbi:MAG: HEAT repeat domain-containing protein [Deltaproteobacteria bacterium]|nr:HEAT repeat domain-containing protein [Deltaproteobacteria bacterium]
MIEPPKELPVKMPRDMPVGACPCGAVYACDVTGHNIGAAMIEALVFGCDMDWDLAWGLLPDEDYLEKRLEHYDIVEHLIVPGGIFQGRRISGVLLFVRLHDDVLEVTENGLRKRLKSARPVVKKQNSYKNKKPTHTLSKSKVEALVRSYDPDPIIEAARQEKKIISRLQRLLYSPDEELRMRTAEILGMAASAIAESDPGFISKLLQNLFTAISDTAASSWGAFEAVAEIIAHKPDMFSGYISPLFSFLADQNRQAECLRAIATIAKRRPEILRKYTFHFIPYLESQEPSVRGYAAMLLANLGAYEARKNMEKLLGDSCPIHLYENGTVVKKTVDQLVREFLKDL